MEDIIQKYKKEQKVKNFSIVVTSLALALALNIFISGTDTGKYLKASVINSQIGTQQQSDLFLESEKNTANIIVDLKTSKDISKVKSISFSLAYNKDNVSVKNKKINFDNAELLNLVDNDGFNTLVINFKNATNIKAGETILSILLDKKQKQNEQLNLVNANITDQENSLFMLSTSGVNF